MGSITQETPKPLLPIHGKPMLEHILERLRAAGTDRFFIVIGYRGELIEQYFGESRWSIQFCRQEPQNGTGAAARLARGFADDEPFLLTYGDILCNPDEYTRCCETLEQHAEAAAVIAVKAVADPWQGAAVYEKQGRIRRIVEKPPKGSSTTQWNSAGFYSFRPLLFDYLDRIEPSSRNEYELTSALDMMLTDGVELRISEVAGEWRDVGRPEDLKAMNT
jgi:NDP-sugar pyrophosphorylase family protein